MGNLVQTLHRRVARTTTICNRTSRVGSKTFSLDDSPAAVDDFLAKKNLDLNDITNLVYPNGSEFLNYLQEKEKRLISSQTLPISFLLKNGEVIWQKKGVIDFNELENEMSQLDAEL